MRLASFGLPQGPSQARRFAQFLRASSFDIDQPAPKRRCLQSRVCYSTERQNGGQTTSATRPHDATVVSASDPSNEQPYPVRLDSVPIRKFRLREQDTKYPVRRGSDREWRLSVDELEFESDVGHLKDIGSKLVDHATHARDFNLWKELLLHRQRHYGDCGTIDIWKGITKRCTLSYLPVAGEDAEFFWQSFVAVGLKHESMLDELSEYARVAWEQRRERWHGLYEAIVGGLLEKGDTRKAIQWHLLLKDVHLSRPSDIIRVFKPAMLSKYRLKAFRTICRTTEGHKIYSRVIPMLWRRDMVTDALNMHHFLVQRNDHPRTLEEVKPLLEHVKDYSWETRRPEFIRKTIRSRHGHKADWLTLLRYGMPEQNNQRGQRSGVEKPEDVRDAPSAESSQTQFTDKFGAKLFATKAFSFDLILSGMQMFSLSSIGPLTLRQMGLRTKNAAELAQQIQTLEKAGISLEDSVFSRVVQKLVGKRDSRTLLDVLQTDQHPDVMEDLYTQEMLFSSYTLSQDWRMANMTFEILSVLSEEDPYSLNIQFRNAVNTGHWAETTELIELVKEKNVVLSKRSIECVSQLALPTRRQGHCPQTSRVAFRALWHLLGTLQYVAKCGGQVQPITWKEGLKRLGMTGRWAELEVLCLWLAHFYSPPNIGDRGAHIADDTTSLASKKTRPNQLAAVQSRSILATIFNMPFQQALMAWGFTVFPAVLHKEKPLRNPWSTNGETLIPWVRGIVLLRQLKEKGVIVHEDAVQKICRHRLAQLYGRSLLSNRNRNRLLRRDNPYRLEELLVDIDKAWGRPLFANFTGSLDELVNPRISSRPRFQRVSD